MTGTKHGEPRGGTTGAGTAASASPAINWPRLAAQLEQLNAINRQPDGSCSRLALTDADRAGRDLVVGWMREAGLTVEIDGIGNIIGVTDSTSGEPPVMTGSHIDTVATGGRFDGTLGVLAGLESIRALRKSGIPLRRPLALGIFTNEEGARFVPDMMGSMAYAGLLPLDEALAAVSTDGKVLGQELARIGYAGTARCGRIVPHSFVELHIEQGPILDRQGGVFGAVVDLQAILWMEVTVRGSSNHAGTTPLAMRRDALLAAARIVAFVRELAERIGGAQVATVGSMHVSPNLVNVIAREARFIVDLRNTDDELLSRAELELRTFIDRLMREQSLTVELRQLQRTRPVRFEPAMIRTIEEVCSEMGMPARRMTSGAGHDAQMIATICPTGMIFIPSIGGVSHNPREDTQVEHLEAGANALLRVMLKLARN